MCQCWLLVSLDVGETAMPTRCFSVPALLVEVNCINVFLEGRKASLVRRFFFLIVQRYLGQGDDGLGTLGCVYVSVKNKEGIERLYLKRPKPEKISGIFFFFFCYS